MEESREDNEIMFVHDLVAKLSTGKGPQTLFQFSGLSLAKLDTVTSSGIRVLSGRLQLQQLVLSGRGRKRCRGNSSRSAGVTAKGRRNGVRATGALSIIPDTRSMVTRSIAMQTMQLEDEGTLYGDETIQDQVEEEMNDDNNPEEQVQPQHEQQEEEQVQPQHEQQEEEQVQPQHEQQEEEQVQPQHEQQEEEQVQPQHEQQEEEQVQPQHEQQEEDQVQPQHEQQVEEQQPQHEQQVEEQQPQQEEQKPANEVVPVPVENKGDGEEMLVLDDLPVICNYDEIWPCSNVGCASGWHYGWDPTNEFGEPFGDANFEPVWDDALWDFKDDDKTKKL
ncbi:hypothetical protein V6N12_074417 [Hibiscus sabdariffa]|uniref:Uncharacterized protein n=1 Tax=Hibiscus sabdariffa TaxID=183260 RepID=A0ABR2BLM7_9ROSI